MVFFILVTLFFFYSVSFTFLYLVFVDVFVGLFVAYLCFLYVTSSVSALFSLFCGIYSFRCSFISWDGDVCV